MALDDPGIPSTERPVQTGPLTFFMGGKSRLGGDVRLPFLARQATNWFPGRQGNFGRDKSSVHRLVMPVASRHESPMVRRSDNIVLTEPAARALHQQFLGWQCRVRQLAVREAGGRPSAGMRPRVTTTAGEEISPA